MYESLVVHGPHEGLIPLASSIYICQLESEFTVSLDLGANFSLYIEMKPPFELRRFKSVLKKVKRIEFVHDAHVSA